MILDCFHAPDKLSFTTRIDNIIKFCKINNVPSVIKNPIEKLHSKIDDYKVAYDYPCSQITSNMVDRLMQRMDLRLFDAQYFHGSLCAAELSIRGWVLIHNFAPYTPYTVNKLDGIKSPAERFNKYKYHDNWLHNLLVSASLGGISCPSPKGRYNQHFCMMATAITLGF